jgi:hypothetical protein
VPQYRGETVEAGRGPYRHQNVICPVSLMLEAAPGPSSMTVPSPLHSVAISTPPTTLNPTTCPALLMSEAKLNVGAWQALSG